MAVQMNALDQELYEQLTQIYSDLLRLDDDYSQKVKDMELEGRRRLLVELNDLRKINEDLPSKVLSDPSVYIPPFEDALRDAIILDNPSYYKVLKNNPKIGFTGWFGRNHVTPRGLSSALVNHMVCVEGIVAQCSIVRPKLVTSVHVTQGNEDCANAHIEIRDHRDISSLKRDRYVIGGMPKEDSEGNKLDVEIGLCKYKDTQRLTIQELPETIPTGQLPRSVEVICEDDLVDHVKPGDRVRVAGLYRPMVRKDGNNTSGMFKAMIVCNAVEQLKKDVINPDVTPHEIKAMKELANRDDALDILTRSFAPSLCGHEYIKRGLLLAALGGNEKNLDNGAHIRGDIHTLLVGEPSCGKSQLLRFVMNIAPLAISTTGRGSSGVGLTAAVTMDSETHERRLEAGAMVLADRGIVCIDEFDKMSNADRVSIHEVMEQQRITVSKAGIQASLNARCSVVAAANPLYGSFDPSLELSRQISFPDSLLSRFDLIYIVRDARSAKEDRKIASQVLAQVRYRAPGENRSANADINGLKKFYKYNSTVVQPNLVDEVVDDEAKVWEPAHNFITSKRNGKTEPILNINFLRKYLHYCKHMRSKPILDDSAVKEIASFYAELRLRSSEHTKGKNTCTTRTLEAIIRLATAHAKLKMRENVNREDVLKACELLNYTLFGDLPSKNNKSFNSEFSDDSDSESTTNAHSSKPKKIQDKPNKARNQISSSSANTPKKSSKRLKTIAERESDDEIGPPAPPPSSSSTPLRESRTLRNEVNAIVEEAASRLSNMEDNFSKLSAARLRELTCLTADYFAATGAECISVDELFKEISSICSKKKLDGFTMKEIRYGLKKLSDENKIMLADDMVFSIV